MGQSGSGGGGGERVSAKRDSLTTGARVRRCKVMRHRRDSVFVFVFVWTQLSKTIRQQRGSGSGHRCVSHAEGYDWFGVMK